MALLFIAIDPETNGNDCPTVWADDGAGDYTIKGWTVTAEFLPATSPDPRETVIRIPKRMARCLQEGSSGARSAV
jgi:hypothetical protein